MGTRVRHTRSRRRGSLSHSLNLGLFLLPQVPMLALPLVVIEERTAEVHVCELRLRLEVDVLLVGAGVLFSNVVGEQRVVGGRLGVHSDTDQQCLVNM